MHVSELKRMGAKINTRNNVATIEGPTNLSGSRGYGYRFESFKCLVLAGLIQKTEQS